MVYFLIGITPTKKQKMNLLKQKFKILALSLLVAFCSFILPERRFSLNDLPLSLTPNGTPPIVYSEIDQKNQEFSLLKIKNLSSFCFEMGRKESSGRYDIINRFGYIGKYQFGQHLLNFYQINDVKTFLNSPKLQEDLFKKSLSHNKFILKEDIETFRGKTINGITITESGILAAAHLSGVSSVKKFLKSNGNFTFEDGNGTSLEDYLAHFSNYDLSQIKPEFHKKS